jgi:hypothetical protein
VAIKSIIFEENLRGSACTLAMVTKNAQSTQSSSC